MTKVFIPSFLTGAALLISCFLLGGCENDPGVVESLNARKPNIEEGYTIESLLSQDGKLKAKLVAPYMLRYTFDTSYLEFPRTLHVSFYDSTAKVESQVDARYGKYLESQSKVFLRDQVVVFNIAGDTLRTPDLWWDQSTRKFYTDKRVWIHRKDQQIMGGKGMVASQDLNDVTIYKIESPSYVTLPDSMRTN